MVRVSARSVSRQGDARRHMVSHTDITRPGGLGKPSAIARELPPVVYFVRTHDGLIKIGHTNNIRRRLKELTLRWSSLLAVIPGTVADERAMHAMYGEHLVRGREYFRPHPDLIDHINEIRDHCNVSRIELEAAPI